MKKGLDTAVGSGRSMFRQGGPLSDSYRVHQFAELSGVTVKALHYYDRLGVAAGRANGCGVSALHGWRPGAVATDRCLEISWASFKNKVVLDCGAMELQQALRMQRGALEDKQQPLGRAIQTIEEAERSIEPGKPADPLILKKLIEVIGMQDSVAVMSKYYSGDAWAKYKAFYE